MSESEDDDEDVDVVRSESMSGLFFFQMKTFSAAVCVPGGIAETVPIVLGNW